MESGIYCIRNIIDNKVYVGSTKNFSKRWKVHLKCMSVGHWNIKLRRAIEKHGIENFIFEIIELIPYEKVIILEREDFYITGLDSKRTGYNIADASFGDQLSNHPNRDEIRKKISASLKLKNSSYTEEERKVKFGLLGKKNGMYGKTHTIEARKRISECNLGNKYGVGRVVTLETRKKLSILASQRTGKKNPFFGLTHSNEVRQKMSAARMNKIPSNRRAIIVDGIEYACLKAASIGTDVKCTTLWHRANSKTAKYSGTYFADEPKLTNS